MHTETKIRLDQFLLESHQARSRSHARALILAGKVAIEIAGEFKIILKPSFLLTQNNGAWPPTRVEAAELSRYVSRGGIKMEGALKDFNLSVQGWRVLDVGISTGGFCDCLLQAGAQQVVGIDVGHGQLSPTLLNDTRVILFEGINARHWRSSAAAELLCEKVFDLVVVDVSFISLELILPEIVDLVRAGGYLLCLVKPQFEVGPKLLSKSGVVKNPNLYENVKQKLIAKCSQLQLTVKEWKKSIIEGTDGNQEFFILAQK